MDVRDQLKCPICYELPLAEVYQCKWGHTLCSTCSNGLSRCPQCRENFGFEKIRSRVSETLLDAIEFECRNKDSGCRVVMKRKELVEHLKTCTFSESTIQLCKEIGLECGFTVGTRNISAALEHLQLSHVQECIVRSTSSLKIILGGLKSIPRDDSIWTPILLKLESMAFLLVNRLNQATQNVSFTCLFMCDEAVDTNSIEITYRINSDAGTAPQLKWSVPPVTLRHASLILQQGLFQIPLKLLREHYTTNDNVVLTCSISQLQQAPEVVIQNAEPVEEPTWTFNSALQRDVPGFLRTTRSNELRYQSAFVYGHTQPSSIDHICNAAAAVQVGAYQPNASVCLRHGVIAGATPALAFPYATPVAYQHQHTQPLTMTSSSVWMPEPETTNVQAYRVSGGVVGYSPHQSSVQQTGAPRDTTELHQNHLHN